MCSGMRMASPRPQATITPLTHSITGGVHIGCHRDNIENRVIASVSLGAVRNFVMSYAPTKAGAAKGGDGTAATEKKKWALANGSLVVMQGDTQRNWKHEIPKCVACLMRRPTPHKPRREAKVKQGRISLTFRQLVYPAK